MILIDKPRTLSLTLLAAILTACGGGGGGDDGDSAGPTGPGPGTGINPSSACFDSYSPNDPKADPYRNNRGQVLYTRDRHHTIYSLDLAQFTSRLVTDEADITSVARTNVSNNGKYIAYLHNDPRRGMQFENLETSAHAESFVHRYVDWSPRDGGYTMSAGAGAYLAYGDPTGEIDTHFTNRGGSNITWSENEKRIALVSTSHIDVFTTSPLVREHVFRLEDEPVGTERFLDAGLSPDGSYLIYQTDLSVGGISLSNFILVNMDTGARKALATNSAWPAGVPEFAWSPSGKFLAIVSDEGNGAVLSTYSTESQQQITLSDTGGARVDPIWAPGADRLLFLEMDPESTRHLRLANNPASSSSRLVVSGRVINHHAWSPGSRYFAYIVETNEGARILYTNDAETDCETKITDVPFSFQTNRWAPWSPSGQYLLYFDTTESFVVTSPNGVEHIPLRDLIVDSGDNWARDVRWTSESDTLHYFSGQGSSSRMQSMNFLEIESLSVLSMKEDFDWQQEELWFRPMH